MPMKDFIHYFSAGKISLKYNLVIPEVSDTNRKIIYIFYLFFLLIMLYLINKVYERFPYYNIGFGFLIWILFGLVTGKIMDFFTSGLISIGKVSFQEDHLEIDYKNESEKINYPDINTIQFQPNVRKSFFRFNHLSDPKSLKVKFILKNKTQTIIEVENDLFLTADDKDQFINNEPDLIRILEKINPKYGVERVKKLNR